MSKKLSIIILNYKTPELVVDCLHSLKSQIEPGIDVVVVDNASNDGSVEFIEEQIRLNQWVSWGRVLCSPINGGFAAGNNLAIQAIEAEAYILLNSDTIVLPDAIKELRQAMESYPRAGLIGPQCVTRNGENDVSTFRFIQPVSELLRSARTGPITRLLQKYDVPLSAENKVFEPDWIGFACVLIRREVINQVGVLDQGFFMYFEDVDYCHRVRKAGWTVLCWPKAKIIHLLGGSSDFTAKGGLQNRSPRFFYEARSRYFAKHYGRFGLFGANMAWILGRCIALLRELFGSKPPHQRKREALDIWINFLKPFRAHTM